jgi:hypothetical protein
MSSNQEKDDIPTKVDSTDSGLGDSIILLGQRRSKNDISLK